MMDRKVLYILLMISNFFFLTGCKEEGQKQVAKDFIIQNFKPLYNFIKEEEKTKSIPIDYSNAIEGVMIPSASQLLDGKFKIHFEIKNKGINPQSFYYKIYYQNDSYKFFEIDSISKAQNPLASENFYGSWDDVSTTFKKTPEIPSDNDFHEINDYFKITGNPRNEKQFYVNGKNIKGYRNPRMGDYTFLLVIATKESLDLIPDYIKNITLKHKDNFINPYYFFLYGQGKEITNLISIKSEERLKVFAKPNLGNGIYINPIDFDTNSKSSFNINCGQDSNLFFNAPFQQFIHYIDPSTRFDNIPVIADVIKDNYSKLDYNWNRRFYKKEELISTPPRTATIPCQTVYSDPQKKSIYIKNPKTEYGKWKKESVGIISRHGFTYGKYRIKAKLTELLNKNNVWNGLTNAIWMINQTSDEFNYRRACNKEGYLATYLGGTGDKRVPQVSYSEIDFEILKTPPYCPDFQFPPVYKNQSSNIYNINSWNTLFPEEITQTDEKITVACTNWDMACWQPENFGVGCQPIKYQDKTFEAHRWDHWYRAITEKVQEKDDELFSSEYFYFEIDWRPTEIIWRIGPEPEKMRVVGYMNDKITSIPNNQMLMIVTQEFHNTKWWPGTPFLQENIPFPKNDIVGEILEFTIE